MFYFGMFVAMGKRAPATECISPEQHFNTFFHRLLSLLSLSFSVPIEFTSELIADTFEVFYVKISLIRLIQR